MDVLKIYDVDSRTMEEYKEGRRTSLMIQLQEPPFIGLKVIFIEAETDPPQPEPWMIFGRVTNIINLSCFLSTQNYYTLTLEIQPE